MVLLFVYFMASFLLTLSLFFAAETAKPHQRDNTWTGRETIYIQRMRDRERESESERDRESIKNKGRSQVVEVQNNV